MKILRLTRKDEALFWDMDPLCMLERLDFPGAFALAAVLEQEGTRGAIPAGLVICRDTGETIIVQWLCVSAKYRRQGIGEQLLAAVYDAAVQAGYTTVCAYLNQEYGRELLCAGEEIYLKDRLFAETRPLAGEWVTDIRTLERAVLSNSKKNPENVRVTPLRTLPIGERKGALQLLQEKKRAAALYPVKENLQLLDADISCLFYEDGKLTGGLLVQSVERRNAQLQGDTVSYYTEHVLYPVFLCIPSIPAAKPLIAAVLKAAAEKYGADSEVHILLEKSTYAPLVENLLPGSRIKNWFLIASVDDYLEQEEQPELQILLSIE